MIKKIKLRTYLYWLLALLPFVYSAVFYSQLPDQMPIHWDSVGNVDNYAAKPIAAWGMPALLLIITLFVNFSNSADPRRQNIERSPMVKNISKWGIVIIANVAQLASIFYATGYKLNVSKLNGIIIGALIILIGNFLPKCKPNYTIGIKLPWTLASEENWRRTHRFAGFVWTICGVFMIANTFFTLPWLSLVILAIMVLLPTAYSYFIFAAQNKND